MASRSPMRSQDHRREAAKRRIMGTFMEETSSSNSNSANQVDGSNPDHVRLMIEDLDAKFQQHLELLNADLFRLKKDQKQVHSTGMMKLPKPVRQMTIHEFNQMYSCNILSVLKSKDGVKQVARENSFQNRDRMPVLKTPAPMRARTQAPGTILRTARKGEAIYSQNGSPVERVDHGAIVATVAKKRKGNETASVEINIGDGKYISLSNPGNIKELDASMKAAAALQLKVLADQMSSLMAALNGEVS